jgi:hypothetical protein
LIVFGSCSAVCAGAQPSSALPCRIGGREAKKQIRETVMATITKSQLRRATATLIIGCVILLPAFLGRARAQSGETSTLTPVAVAWAGATAL